EAYPVYITIGNIPKSVRRKVNRHATVLLGYLPVDTFSEVTDVDERARLRHQLTHDALTVLMEPLRRAAKEGVVMTCADGRQRRIYPIPAAFEGDWPEQCGMACADEGGCPVCEQIYDQRSHYPNLAPLRNPDGTLAALRACLDNDKDPGELKPLRLKPWWPWWASIPYMNFHASIMPDLLHQLYQGMLKTHVIAWTKKAYDISRGESVEYRGHDGQHDGPQGCGQSALKAISAILPIQIRTLYADFAKHPRLRCGYKVRIIRTFGVHRAGRESKETAKQLLPVVAGQESVKPAFVSLVRSMLDFTYRSHKTQMSEGDLQRLERTLGEFHDKKPVLVALGIHRSLKSLNRVKKLHMLTHFYSAICEMGTPDGYNTESPEHLHIIYAKRGWRASNKVRPLPQMVKFIQRYEAIRIHRMYIDLYYGCQAQNCHESRVVYGDDENAISEGVGRRLVDENEEPSDELIEDGVLDEVDEVDEGDEVYGDDDDEDSEDKLEGELTRIRSRTPTSQYLSLDPEWSIATKPTVSRMKCDEIIGRYGAHDLVSRTNEWLEESTEAGLLPPLQFVTSDHTFDIWHKFYLHHRLLRFDPDLPARRDTIRAQPPLAVPDDSLRSVGPGKFDTVLFLAKPKESGVHLYLELFTPFSRDFSTVHRMHTVSHDMHRGIRRTIVMPLVWVVAACHLVPLFSQFDHDSPFDCCDALSTGKEFFFNHYSSNFMFGLVDHWRMIQDKAAEAKAEERRAAEEEARRIRVARSKAARAKLVRVQAALDSNLH
ncbi:hypothetical protein FRC11_012493, partial [Ceratobasidium sp. 423]